MVFPGRGCLDQIERVPTDPGLHGSELRRKRRPPKPVQRCLCSTDAQVDSGRAACGWHYRVVPPRQSLGPRGIVRRRLLLVITRCRRLGLSKEGSSLDFNLWRCLFPTTDLFRRGSLNSRCRRRSPRLTKAFIVGRDVLVNLRRCLKKDADDQNNAENNRGTDAFHNLNTPTLMITPPTDLVHL